MIINIVLLVITILMILLTIKLLESSSIHSQIINIPICHFKITNPLYLFDYPIRIAKFSIIGKDRKTFFKDFPIGFKFYSESKFKSYIKISYMIEDDNESEIIFEKEVEFEDNIKEHNYYINNIIISKIDIEIYTKCSYGKPIIEFEILQGSSCHLDKEHKIIIDFPE